MSKYAKYVIRAPKLAKEIIFYDFKSQLAAINLQLGIFIDKQVLKEEKRCIDFS